jgi:hypothetical protein
MSPGPAVITDLNPPWSFSHAWFFPRHHPCFGATKLPSRKVEGSQQLPPGSDPDAPPTVAAGASRSTRWDTARGDLANAPRFSAPRGCLRCSCSSRPKAASGRLVAALVLAKMLDQSHLKGIRNTSEARPRVPFQSELKIAHLPSWLTLGWGCEAKEVVVE